MLQLIKTNSQILYKKCERKNSLHLMSFFYNDIQSNSWTLNTDQMKVWGAIILVTVCREILSTIRHTTASTMNITDCPEIRTPIISSRHATLLSLPLPLSSCSFMPLSLSLSLSPPHSPLSPPKRWLPPQRHWELKQRETEHRRLKKRSRSERTACLLPTKTAKEYIKSSQAFSTLVGREGGWIVVTGADLCECGEMWTAHGWVQECREEWRSRCAGVESNPASLVHARTARTHTHSRTCFLHRSRWLMK